MGYKLSYLVMGAVLFCMLSGHAVESSLPYSPPDIWAQDAVEYLEENGFRIEHLDTTYEGERVLDRLELCMITDSVYMQLIEMHDNPEIELPIETVAVVDLMRNEYLQEVEDLRWMLIEITEGSEDEENHLLSTKGPFAEVPTGHWSYLAIDSLQNDGFIIGYPDGTFDGQRSFVRYELATVVARAYESSIDHMRNPDTETPIEAIALVRILWTEFKDEVDAAGYRLSSPLTN